MMMFLIIFPIIWSIGKEKGYNITSFSFFLSILMVAANSITQTGSGGIILTSSIIAKATGIKLAYYSLAPVTLVLCLGVMAYMLVVKPKLNAEDSFKMNESLDERPEYPKWKMYAVLTVFFAQIVAFSFDKFAPEIVLFASLAVLLVVGCLDMKKAYRGVPWDILVLIGCTGGITAGVVNSGLAKLITDKMLLLVGTNPNPYFVLSLIAVATIISTALLSNILTITTLSAIALVLANTIHINPLSMLVIIGLLGFSADFLTPFGTYTALIKSNIKYTSWDCIKFALPLTLIMAIVLVVLLPIQFPF
jgi:di/tricarboxylate transporter